MRLLSKKGQTMVNENWIDVVGFEGYYQVSDLGRVRSLDRRIITKGGERLCKGRVLKQTCADGYFSVSLSKENCVTRRRVHILVLETFTVPRQFGYETRHLNGNGLDNKLSNLCWGTSLENSKDSHRHYTSVRPTLRKPVRLDNGEVFSSTLELAHKLGVSGAAVRQAISKGYRCCGYRLEYV